MNALEEIQKMNKIAFKVLMYSSGFVQFAVQAFWFAVGVCFQAFVECVYSFLASVFKLMWDQGIYKIIYQ